jgi:hypothetical protein
MLGSKRFERSGPARLARLDRLDKGFRELRSRAGRSRWRPIYRQVSPTTFVVFAVGPEAQIDQRGFQEAIGRADKRFAEIEPD